MTTTNVQYLGHDEWQGLDYLLTIFPDGSAELASREGRDQTQVRWSPPVPMSRIPIGRDEDQRIPTQRPASW